MLSPSCHGMITSAYLRAHTTSSSSSRQQPSAVPTAGLNRVYSQAAGGTASTRAVRHSLSSEHTINLLELASDASEHQQLPRGAAFRPHNSAGCVARNGSFADTIPSAVGDKLVKRRFDKLLVLLQHIHHIPPTLGHVSLDATHEARVVVCSTHQKSSTRTSTSTTGRKQHTCTLLSCRRRCFPQQPPAS